MIPIAKPLLGEEELQAVRSPVLSGWVTQGPEVQAFEREFASWVGAEHACAVSSCTTALHLSLLVAGVKPGDEVITVSSSFIATANSVRYAGAVPVFVDIEPDTFNINPGLIEKQLSPKTRAILCVHQMGMPANLEALAGIARRHSLPLIEDAACAAGSEILWSGRWEKIGRPRGDIACFSFHPRKVITTGDGGMITTGRSDWDRQLRLLRQHGMSVSDAVRHASNEVVFESYPVLGYNYRMTDIQAAIGRVQLKRLSGIVERRRQLAARYRRLLAGSEIKLPGEPSWARSNWQSFCVRLPREMDPKKVMQFMMDRGISTRRGIMCTHREGAYPSGTWAGGKLAESEAAQDHCIVLPLFPQLTDDEQDLIVAALLEICSLVQK